jgi:hypothetical protein
MPKRAQELSEGHGRERYEGFPETLGGLVHDLTFSDGQAVIYPVVDGSV